MASGTAPPYIPEWTAWSRVRTVDDARRRRPRRLVVRAGSPMPPVAGVGDDDDVGARAGRGARSRNALERRRADLLLALDEDRDADREVVRRARAARRGAAMTPALSSAAPRP